MSVVSYDFTLTKAETKPVLDIYKSISRKTSNVNKRNAVVLMSSDSWWAYRRYFEKRNGRNEQTMMRFRESPKLCGVKILIDEYLPPGTGKLLVPAPWWV